MYVVKSKPFFSFHYMPMRQKVCLKGLKTSLVSDNNNDICTREKNWEVYLAQVHWKVTKYLWHFREKKLTVNFAWICRDLKMYLLKVTLLWWCWERIHTFMQWRISKTLTFQIFSQSKVGHYPRKRKKFISKG